MTMKKNGVILRSQRWGLALQKKKKSKLKVENNENY